LDTLVSQIEALNKFVSNERFKEFQVKTGEGLEGVQKVRDELGRFVPNEHFNEFREETAGNFQSANESIGRINEHAKEMDKQINCIDDKATKASEEAEQNSNMVKEINFAEMQQRLKKFRDDTESKLGEMALKLKRKVGSSELGEVERNIVERLDGFLAGNDPKADRQETKDALSFLERRINEMCEALSSGAEGEGEMDALFASRKWMCASCTKDLGKYEGKLGQFRPWAVFPCRELDPEKTGGYGYLNYIDKVAYKKGLTVDDAGLEKLHRTFFDKSTK
jgi:hypothetical protein